MDWRSGCDKAFYCSIQLELLHQLGIHSFYYRSDLVSADGRWTSNDEFDEFFFYCFCQKSIIGDERERPSDHQCLLLLKMKIWFIRSFIHSFDEMILVRRGRVERERAEPSSSFVPVRVPHPYSDRCSARVKSSFVKHILCKSHESRFKRNGGE